jgi:DNA-binding NarL/FixJ family response regulator
MRVLLAIPDTDLRLSIELLLSEEPGVVIAGVASETEGLLALIVSTKPSIVILDWDLPGRPAADRLIQTSLIADQPRFIVLGSRLAAREEARQAGMAAFVVKGEPPELLLAAYRQTKMEIRISTGHSITQEE